MIIYEIVTVALIISGIIIIISSYFIDNKMVKDVKRRGKEKREEDYEEYGERIKELNNKILELNEYHEFMKQEMESKHKELLFLYQMISDKTKEIKKIETKKVTTNSDNSYKEKEVVKEEQTEKKMDASRMDNNKMILDLAGKGHSVKEIARMLDIGQGEVKLVLNLFE